MRIQEIAFTGFAFVASTNALYLGNLNYTRSDRSAKHNGNVRPWSPAKLESFSSNNSEDTTGATDSLLSENGVIESSSSENASSSISSNTSTGSKSTGLDFGELRSLLQTNGTSSFPDQFKSELSSIASELIPEGGVLELLADTFMANSSSMPLNVSKLVEQFDDLLQVDLSEALKGLNEIANFTEGPSGTDDHFDESFVVPFIPHKGDFDGFYNGSSGLNAENAPKTNSEPEEDVPLISTLEPSSIPQEKQVVPEDNGVRGRMPIPEPPVFAKREAEQDTKSSHSHEDETRSDHAKQHYGQVATCEYRGIDIDPRDISEKTQEEIAAEKTRAEDSSKYLPNRM